jgi:hypothetical protein
MSLKFDNESQAIDWLDSLEFLLYNDKKLLDDFLMAKKYNL